MNTSNDSPDHVDVASELQVPKGKTGVPRLVAATKYSMSGLRAVFKNEEAFRLEVYAFVILAPLGLWLGETGVERALLVGVVVFVMIVELLNTAIEVVIDRISEDFHELSGRAKDIGSACVLIAMTLGVLVWGLILFTGS